MHMCVYFCKGICISGFTAFTTFTAFRSRRSRDCPVALLRLYLELLRLFRKCNAVPCSAVLQSAAAVLRKRQFGQRRSEPPGGLNTGMFRMIMVSNAKLASEVSGT